MNIRIMNEQNFTFNFEKNVNFSLQFRFLKILSQKNQSCSDSVARHRSDFEEGRRPSFPLRTFQGTMDLK